MTTPPWSAIGPHGIKRLLDVYPKRAKSSTWSALGATLAVAAALLINVPSHAQTVDEMREELKQLREEVNALKQAKPPASVTPAVGTSTPIPGNPVAVVATPPAPTSGPDPRVAEEVIFNHRIDALEKKTKDMIAVGRIPGGLLMPGTSTSLYFYGYAEVHAIHDFKQSSAPDIFTDLTYQPLNSTNGSTGSTQFTAETSRFGFDTATPIGSDEFKTKLEMGFYSYGTANENRLRVRQAYGQYGGWLIGQTWSTFDDIDDLPETLDFNGPIGAPFSLRTVIKYTAGDPTKRPAFTFAAEDPKDQSGGTGVAPSTPEFVVRMDRTFGWGAVNVRVLEHEKRSPVEQKYGFGFAVGGSYKLTKSDLLMVQITQVDGDIDQLYGANGYVIDTATGHIRFDRNRGLVTGYAHVFSAKLRSNLSIGLNRGTLAAEADNHTLKELFANLIYTPFKNMDLGAEWILGQRITFTGDTGSLSRLDFMGRFSF